MRRLLAVIFTLSVIVACNDILGIPDVQRQGTGSNGCTADQKRCGDRCVDTSSPVTGCGGVSCEPCAVALETCFPGWLCEVREASTLSCTPP